MKKYALIESEENELFLRLFDTFKEGADEVIDRMKDTLSKEEGDVLEGMLNNYNMEDYYTNETGKADVFINEAQNTIEAWHINRWHYVARLVMIDC